MVRAEPARGRDGGEGERLEGVGACGPLTVVRGGAGEGGALLAVVLDEALANAQRHAAARSWFVVPRWGVRRWWERGGLRVGLVGSGIRVVPGGDVGSDIVGGGGGTWVVPCLVFDRNFLTRYGGSGCCGLFGVLLSPEGGGVGGFFGALTLVAGEERDFGLAGGGGVGVAGASGA